jgi:hypothetical protein
MILDWWAAKHRPWTVAVVRLGSVSTWNDIRPKVVFREVLPEDVEPTARIADLVEEIQSGRFRPE